MTELLLFGATQRTGLEIAKRLAEQGTSITAFARPTSETEGLEALKASLVTGDATVADDVDGAFAAASPRTVISTIGGSRRGANPPDFISTQLIVDAAIRHGAQRMILVTMIGAGDSASVLSPIAMKFLGPIAALKTQAEDYLMASSLPGTVIRPGGMKSEDPTGTAILSLDHSLMGIINRADLATLTVDCLADSDSVGQIYHAIDPSIDELPPLQRGEAPVPGAPKP